VVGLVFASHSPSLFLLLTSSWCALIRALWLTLYVLHAVVSRQVEDCINFELEPRPVSYGAKRRMARRFDEALIVEIEPVALR
jgi:hypothetical protein